MYNNTSEEVWKDIVGYEGLYKISSHGRVWSCKSEIIRKQAISKGYNLVKLHKDKKVKTIAVHRLVASHFIENPHNKREVNHLDENKQNNHASNLQWVTSKENANWGSRNKRISDYVKANPVVKPEYVGTRIRQVCMITGRTVRIYDTVIDASRENGIHQPNISSCINGKKKSAGGYRWERIS